LSKLRAVFAGATTLSITKLSIMTFSIMELRIKGINVTLSKNDTEYNNALPLF
jgi:hypothetical protein